MRRLLRSVVPVAVIALAATGCVSSSDIEGINTRLGDIERQLLQVQMQTSSKEEVASLESNLERQMERVLESEANVQVRIGELTEQIEQLQAKLEDTNYRLSQLSQQIAATNQELRTFRTQQRAAAVDAGTGDGASPTPGGPADDGADPQTLYQSAYNDYLRGNYDMAVLTFEEYLERFPQTDLADNATYWIGECFYREGEYRQAIDQFDQVLRRYPRSDKTPSALLKKGYAYLELGERSQGIVQLQYVVREHSDSEEANLARDRLRALGIDPGA